MERKNVITLLKLFGFDVVDNGYYVMANLFDGVTASAHKHIGVFFGTDDVTVDTVFGTYSISTPIKYYTRVGDDFSWYNTDNVDVLKVHGENFSDFIEIINLIANA